MGQLSRRLICLMLLLTLLAPAAVAGESPEALSAEDEALLEDIELLILLELLEEWDLIEPGPGPSAEPETEDEP